MKRNMGTVDRVIRFFLGVAAAVACFFVSGPWQIVLLVVAIILLGTAAYAVCPIYMPFKISTAKK